MDPRAKKVLKQKAITTSYLKKLTKAGMSREGVAVNASHMVIAIILENITPPQMVGVVTEALTLQTKALVLYQNKVEDNLDLNAVDEAAREANEALNEVYGDD